MSQVVLNIVGDVCLANITDDEYSFSKNVCSILESADLNVANLECSITESELKLPYQPIHLKGLPIDTAVFKAFDVYSLANNHVMDYQSSGLSDTIEYLKRNGKNYFGAGMNRKQALDASIVRCKDIEIAFLSFTRFNNATNFSAGTAPEDFRTICSRIKSLKKRGCFVIICPYWNYQWIEYPAPDEIKKGHLLIDAGADLIAGAHPHIIQGMEVYKGKKIYHSLGNFVFRKTKYTKTIPQFGKTFILNLQINKDLSYETTMIPAISNNDGVSLVEDVEELELFEQNWARLSNPLISKKSASRHFYDASLYIEHHNQIVFGELKKDGGRKAVMRAYLDANLQDAKRKLFAICYKKLGLKIF